MVKFFKTHFFYRLVRQRENELSGVNLDVFISYATEDRDAAARPIAEALKGHGLTVWLDECEIRVGSNLRREIENALLRCRFGVVILSPAYFEKQWTRLELDALFSREVTSGSWLILPVWHQISARELFERSPFLAARHGVSTEKGIKFVADQLLKVLLDRGLTRYRGERPRESLLYSFDIFRAG